MISEGHLYESQHEENDPTFVVKIKRLEFLESQRSASTKLGSDILNDEADIAMKAKKEAKVLY